jgi:glycosyltransferase involved in cell wall biosynthesis
MITIITTTLNSALTIHDCLNSVNNQEERVEHLIIDGVSNDGTLDTLNSYAHISKVISEPDQGIYDAMNKGISQASGSVIGILNSDDFYADSSVLKKVASVFENPDVDSCYGNLVYVDPSNTARITRYWKSGNFSKRDFYWGWMPPHPTFFVRRSIYERYGLFNLALGTAADYELMFRFLVKHKITTAYIPEVLVKMRAGGTSNASLRNRIRANKMDRLAWEVNGIKPYPWTTYLKPLRKLNQYLVFG